MKTKLLRDQSGASLLMVMAVVGLGIAGLSYTLTDLLPKLQKEKTKVEASINYKAFMASLNDYVIHALRERWCFEVKNGNETDLLMSNRCGKDYAMEDIVTYPGNIERILWTTDNIGTPPESMEAAQSDNRILSNNYIRYHSSPRQATRLLKFEDIAPPDNKLTFKLTKNVLNDMSTEHPLYMMTRAVKECVDSVDIELFQVMDTSNVQSGDERRIGISIKTNITPFKMKCITTREVSSMSYYTFYPRRLHSFALLKYGNLSGEYNNEFHGPVYIAGDFILPPEGSDTKSSTVFYNTVTLGVYNGGSEFGGGYRAGRIIKSDGSPFSFNERGHPYLSKQDSYKGFRGFRGGVRLDASEDKGFYNLFSHTSTSAADMNKLKECIDEAKYQTTPSLNEKSFLAYTEYTNTGYTASLRVAFTERNRFKKGVLPKAIKETKETKEEFNNWNKNRDDPDSLSSERNIELLMKVPTAPNGTVSYGEFYIHPKDQIFDWTKDNHYGATIGSGSSVELYFNYSAFDLTEETVNRFKSNLERVDRGNFRHVIEPGHILSQLDEVRTFQQKAENLRNRCDERTSEECHFFGYSDIDCGRSVPGKPYCNYSKEVDDYRKALTELQNKINRIQAYVSSNRPEDEPKMVISMDNYYKASKMVLNHKKLNFTFSESWKFFFPLLKKRLNGIRFQFRAYNYSKNIMTMNLDLVADNGSSLEFSPQNFTMSPDKTLYNTSWRKGYDNKSFYPDPKEIVELDCPNGMGLADWDLDMSPSTAFAWNYANTPAGAFVDAGDHENLSEIQFNADLLEGHRGSTSKSVVEECIISPTRKIVYGFYVCKKLVIKDRTEPLYMIGTFIVKDLVQSKLKSPVYWHSIWDAKAGDLVTSDLNATNAACGADKLTAKTFNDLMKDDQLKARLIACSSLDLVNNGPNNFSWTTVDPDIGIANPGDSMTSQKVNRIQKWVIKEESRVEVIR